LLDKLLIDNIRFSVKLEQNTIDTEWYGEEAMSGTKVWWKRVTYYVNELYTFVAVPMMCGVSTWKIKHGISKLPLM
jgi:hypothetical protein